MHVPYQKLTILLFALLALSRLQAHVFKLYADTNEEMKDKIIIQVQPDQITIKYESEYHGQIAPHIRYMADSSADSILNDAELKNFFTDYKKAITEAVQTFPIFISAKPTFIKLTKLFVPTIKWDKLADPLKIGMIFKAENFKMNAGENELAIDPRMLFLNGNQFIKMAKERATFTDEQEKVIARFLQIKIFAAESIDFSSSYPGYIKKNKKMIYGIFYDETALRIQFLPYPKLKIKLKVK